MDKNPIGQIGSNYSITFTTPSDCHYILFSPNAQYGTTYANNICINLSWDGSRDGEYEPYISHSYPLDDSLTLRGIPKLNASNQLYYDGDRYESDGTVTRRYGVVDLGELTWVYDSTRLYFYCTLSPAPKGQSASSIGNAVCNGYTTIAFGPLYTGTDLDKVCSLTNGGGNSLFYAKNTAYTDATAFKNSLSGVYLVYELATPTTETAEPYQNPQIADPSGTEEYVTTSIVPVGHETEYPTDLLGKLEQLSDIPEPPSTNGTYQLEAVVSGGQVTYIWS